jgi:hypothetical protein
VLAETLGIIEAACHHVDFIRVIVVAIRKRRAANTAKATGHVRRGMKLERLSTLKLEPINGKSDEWQHRRSAGPAARAAMANSAYQGFTAHAIANPSARTPTL